jgi:hypothetical protein
LDLLLDTHVLVWFAAGDARMGQRFLSLLPDAATRLFVSAVTAHEYVDLLARGRFGEGVGLDQLRDLMGFHLLDFPAASWETVQPLPTQPWRSIRCASFGEGASSAPMTWPHLPKAPVRHVPGIGRRIDFRS